MSMCQHHRRQYDGWLDYNEPITGWVQFGSNEDHRARMSVEVYNAKVEDQRKLIRDHLDGIVELCRDRRGCSPRLLDLFCCAGGAAMGYHRAGFAVTGIDIKPQPNYPFEFHQGDALEYLEAHGHEYDAIHASPPCQSYSAMSKCRPGLAETYPDLVGPTRRVLDEVGVPYVIENVVGSPVRPDVTLCGHMFNLPLYRHRVFESNVALPQPDHVAHTLPASKAGHWRPGTIMSISGHVSPIAKAREAMGGIDWMNRAELAEAIPPQYTQHLGEQLLAHMTAEVAA